MRNYTCLSNDSSYSVSFEDGVDIVLLDSSSSDDDDKKSLEYLDNSSDTSNISSYSESDPIPSFSFEAQVSKLLMIRLNW